jgi:hypothetical protein
MKASEYDDIKLRSERISTPGTNERQDAYLYGHPQGRKKRYRSPAEFFPHVLWLATDESGDPNNCSCKLCSPEELEADKAKDVKSELPAKTPEPIKALPKPASKLTASSTSLSRKSQPLGKATALPRQRCLEQKQDQRYDEFHYRPGELVWFCKGQAWGIGAIVDRQYLDGVRTYFVQPLTHQRIGTTIASLPQDQIRNWLAWSPPPLTHSALNPSASNNNRVLTFPDIDWSAVINGSYGRGDATVDSSILAAKLVETSYTVIDRIDARPPPDNPTRARYDYYYNCMYFGGEKIWLGDPLRLRTSVSSAPIVPDIFILHAIVEKDSSAEEENLFLVGDVYTLHPSTPLTAASSSSTTQNLPPRVLADLQARNKLTSKCVDASKRNFTWLLTSTSTTLTLADIKGRWYESTLFTPILDPAAYTSGKAKGELLDAGLFMNGQGDCNREPGAPSTAFRAADTKVAKREMAFGRSVPPTFKISKGLDAAGSEAGSVGVRASEAGRSGGQLGRTGTPTPAQQQQQQQLSLAQQAMQQAQAQQGWQQQQQQAQQVQLRQQQYPDTSMQIDDAFGDGGDGGAFDQYMQFDES